MTGIEHIATLYSAGWFGWAMMLLATCAVLSEVFQPGVISSVTASVFALSDRTYKQTPDNFPGQLMATLFRLGTPALLLIMAIDDRFDSAGNGLLCYAIALAMIVGMMMIKMLCNGLIDYTFTLRAFAAGVTTHYANTATLSALVQFPMMLILPLFGSLTVNRWAAGISAVLFIGLITYRLARIYLSGAKAIGYILIYVLTLEVLPVGALAVGLSQIMKII